MDIGKEGQPVRVEPIRLPRRSRPARPEPKPKPIPQPVREPEPVKR